MSGRGKIGRFDARQLLNDIQHASTSTSAFSNNVESEEDDQGDDDFMSDKYLPTVEVKQPLTYSQKRFKIAHQQAPSQNSSTKLSIRERELEARREGLDRDLLAEAEILAGGGTLPPEDSEGNTRWDLVPQLAEAFEERAEKSLPAQAGTNGTSKAMKMMLAMGYKRGQALGKPASTDEVEEEEDDDVSSVDSVDEVPPPIRLQDETLDGDYSDQDTRLTNVASTEITKPIELDERWLGINKRAGIGMIPKTKPSIQRAIRAATTTEHDRKQIQQAEEQDFRSRASQAHQERHTHHLLTRARMTLVGLDKSELNVAYSPLWLDSGLYLFASGNSAAIDPTSKGSGATLDDRLAQNPATKEAFELLQHAFTSENSGQSEEAKAFCLLPEHAQLDLVLQELRQSHSYCLFCGCKYQDANDLDTHCPGQTEDDHD